MLLRSEQVTRAQGEAIANQWKCKFFETSAKSKINNEECFAEVRTVLLFIMREIRIVLTIGHACPLLSFYSLSPSQLVREVRRLDSAPKGKEKKKFWCNIL